MSKSPDFNKIFSGILMAALVAGLSGFVSSKLVSPEFPEKKGFAVAVAEAGEGTVHAAAAPAEAEPIEALLASANIEVGQKLSRACVACHTFDKGGANRVGPNLYGTVGAKQAGHAGFAYSEALKKMGGNWSVENLNKYLFNPKQYAPGNKMAYAGMKKAEDRAALIAYLQSLK